MDRTVSPLQHDSTKRRRILSDIANRSVQPIESHTRRKTLGFDLVRIDISNQDKSESLAPKSQLDMKQRGSGIPTLRGPDRYEKLLNISESLNRKCKVNTTHYNYSSTNMNESSRQLIEKLTQELEDLDTEIRQASEDLALVDDEYSHQNMLHRALKTEMTELNNVLRDHEAKFEYLLSQATSKVELKQKKIDVALREYRTKADDSYNNAKFDLENELLNVSVFDDTEDLLQIEELKRKKQTLQNKLDTQLELNRKLLEKAEATHENSSKTLEMNLKESIDIEFSKLTEQENLLKSLDDELVKLQESINSQRHLESDLQAQIVAKEELIHNYSAVRGDWQAQLHDLNGELRNYNQSESDWSQEVQKAKADHDREQKKLKNYTKTRRALEYALSQYGKSRKSFLIIPKMTPDSQTFQEFDKIIETAQLSEKASMEWQLHTQESLRKSMTAMIFAGSTQTSCLEFIKDALNHLLEGSQSKRFGGYTYEFFIQSVRITNKRLVDLFNRSSELVLNLKGDDMNLVSQKMSVSGPHDIDTAFQNISLDEHPSLHLFTIIGTQKAGEPECFKSSLCLVDISKASLAEQSVMLTGTSGNIELQVLLKHILKYQKCLSICELDDIDSLDAKNFAQAIQHFNS